ncbi:MAG: aminotransferase class I/II-fold pyridoxal phosphate-dependent enzyme [bacterium]
MEFPALQKAGALEFLSGYGQQIYNPTGIFYWTGRSKTEAKINATIGSAMGHAKQIFDGGDDSKITFCIPSVKKYFPNLSTEEIFPYAPEVGVPAFRESWKEWLLHKSGARADYLRPRITLPMVSPGITGGISLCVRMFVDPGMPIIVTDKRWENYDNVFLRNVFTGIEEFPSFQGQDFNLEGFTAAVQRVWEKHDRAVALLNFPNNPTGYCPPKAAAVEIVKAIHDLVSGTDKKLVLMLDDAYEGYVYDDGAEKGSLFYQLEARPNLLVVKLDGISKEMLWYGARIGAITLLCPDDWFEKAGKDDVLKEIENKFRGIVRNTVSNCSLVAQSVVHKALRERDTVLHERQKAYNVLKERYLLMKKEMCELSPSLLVPDPFQGGFFCFVNINPNVKVKASDVCDHLLKAYKIGTVPLEVNAINGIRLAYCGVERGDIPELCHSLQKALRDKMG